MSTLLLVAVIVFIKKLAQNSLIWIDFYISYFIIPFLALSFLLLFICRVITIKSLLKMQKSPEPHTDSVQAQNCSNISNILLLIFCIAVCLLVVFSIVGFYNQKTDFPFSEKLSAVFTEDQKTVKLTFLDKAAIETDITYWDGNTEQIHFICDIAQNCSPKFIENWRNIDAKSFIRARKSPKFEYRQLEYKDAKGEWKKELNKNEITLYLYNDKSYVYMQVDRNEAIGDEMISEAEILNYCYLLLK